MKRLDDQWQQKKRSTYANQFIKNHPTGNEIKTYGKTVEQNSDGIKPQSAPPVTTFGGKVNLAGGGGNGSQAGKTRYLGRMAVTSSKTACRKTASTKPKDSDGKLHAENPTVQETSNHVVIPSPKTQSSSFGPEYDDDLLCAMDKLEKDYMTESERIKSGLADQINLPTAENHPEKVVPIVPRVEADLPRYCSPGNVRSIKSAQVKSVEPATIHTRVAVESQKQQNKTRETAKLEAISFATPSYMVTEIVKGHLGGNAELDFSSTWGTPLHVSTPANGNKGTGKHRMSRGSLKANSHANLDTPKVLSTKPREKTKLFQAILNSDNENDSELRKHHLIKADLIRDHSHSSSSCDQAISSTTSQKNKQLPGQENVTAQQTTVQHQSPDTSSANDRLLLSSWGLPETILDNYEACGITSMFEWQAECLCTGNALARGNLIYAAPTSAGKTMVAELLMLKCVLETKKKALFILPFVSVAREKVSYLQGLFKDAGVCVDGYFGHTSPAGGFSSVDIAICTIEKANNLVNRLLEDQTIDQLGMVVVDELHMVGDSSRGYLLELLLTKLRFVVSRLAAKEQLRKVDSSSSSSFPNPIQVVGMSATLPNLDLLAHWLNADLYRTDFRPVPLTEMVKIGLDIYDSTLNKLRSLSLDKTFKSDEDHIIPLCLETIGDGCSVLIFCPTKNWCEKLADTIAREFFRVLLQPSKQTGFVKASELVSGPLNHPMLRDVVEQLRRTPVGLDPMLGKMIPCGVAFHHAGLTFDERDIVEGAFRLGALKVLVATSTLSSGVNLPARRVIVRTPVFHGGVVDTMSYRQMIGRAGRKGVDTQGESILVCKASERHMAHHLLTSELSPVSSCLFPNSSGSLTSSMKRAILEIVVSKVASTPEEVDLYARCTMLSAEVEMKCSEGNSDPDVDKTKSRIDSIQMCISYLKEHEFILLNPRVNSDGISTDVFIPTQLGSAVVASGLSPDEGLIVFGELQKARRCFVLENELHTVYLVTPVYMQDQYATLDWYKYLCLWEQLPQDMKRVAELVGVQERFLARAAGGRIPCETVQQARILATHKRFYSALILHDLVNEMSLSAAVRKYGCTRGVLQSLQQSASTFAGMVTVFSNKLGWSNLEMLLSQFQCRLSFGVQPELVDLVRISLLNGQRARIVYNGGYATVAMLAAAEPAAIEKLLHTASPFLSKKKADDEMDWELEERLKSRCIWAAGQNGLTEREAALLIVEEARELLKDDLQHLGIEWKPAQKSDKALEKDSSGQQCIAYKRKKTASKETKNSSKKCDNVGISLENSNSAVVNNRSVLTPPSSMKRLTQQRSLLSRDSLPITSSTGEGRKSDIPDAPVKLVEPNMQPASMQDILDSVEQVTSSVVSNAVANDHVGLSEATSAHQKSHDTDSDRIAQSESMVGVDEAMLIMSESNTSATMDWSLNKTLERPVTDVLNGACVVESADLSMVSLERSRLDLDVQIGGSVVDITGDSMEMSDGSLMLDTQTMKMITDATNIDRYLPKVQNLEVVTDDMKQVSNIIKEVTYASTADTPLLFSEADEELDVCLLASSFLTQKPVNVSASVCSEFRGRGVGQPQICSERVNAMNLRMVGDNVNTGCGAGEEHVEPTFTNLVPLSNYERERCSGEGRLSDVLFENDDSQGDDTVLRSSAEAFLHLENNGEILTPRGDSPIDIVDKAALSDDNIFANSDACHSADNSNDLRMETVAVIRLHENAETFLNLETAVGKTSAFITSSLTTSIIVKVLADGEMQLSYQNEFLFGNDDCSAVVESVTKLNGNAEEAQINRHDVHNNLHLDHAVTDRGLASPNQKAQDLSPEMESIMSALCGTQTRRLPKRSSKRPKSSFNAKNNKSSGNTEKETKRIRQSTSILEEQIDAKENNYENQTKTGNGDTNQMSRISSGSDSSACIPPTPPSLADDASKTSTPKRLLGGVVGTPKKPDSKPPLAKILGDVDSNEVNIVNNLIPGSGPNSSRHQVHSPRGSRFDRDAVEVLQQNSYAADDNRLIPTTQSFTVIDVAANRLLFENFIKEWRCRKSFSLSLACERCNVTAQRSRSKAIGSKFTAVKPKQTSMKIGLHVEGSDIAVVGVAISWENCDVYYVSFMPSDCNSCDLDSSLAAPPLDEGLSVQERLEAVKSVLEDGQSQTVAVFDLKEQYKLLCCYCGIVPNAQFADVKVACWLMDPDAKEKNLHSMVTNYCPSICNVLDGTGCGAGIESLGLTVNNSTTSGRIRASTEAVVVNHLMNTLTNVLRKSDLYRCFTEVEMPAVAILAKMELNGMGFSEVECDTQRGILQAKMEALENHAYQLAGHPFSLTSTDDVSQVLFMELRLPPTGDPSSLNPVRTLGTTNRGKTSKGRPKQSFSTSKDVLEKLKRLHPLPGLLLEWRRISSALTKVVFPLQKEKAYNANVDMFRIYGKSDFHTSTGRVTMHEPNLQNVPKDFEIAMPGVADEESTDGSTFGHTTRGHRGRAGSSNRQTVKDVLANVGPSYSVSMRNSFVPFKGGILLAADYSQLELRIIAHLSNDRKLIDVLNGGEDVFKAIASQLKMVSVESVTTEQRQQAKQVCYGMIYGIGPPALAEQLGVSANDASVFIETFKDKYTGMRRFLHETVKSCRDDGYVKMISGRMRHLPAIKDTNPHSRAHAERQAVNSTVQGSAADLVKTAMIRIDRELAKKFPETIATHRHLRNDSEGRTRSKVSQRVSKARGAYFILQLHDELIYEVHQTDFKQVARIIKENMENAMTLSVKLPVKLKAGPSWGCMHDVVI